MASQPQGNQAIGRLLAWVSFLLPLFAFAGLMAVSMNGIRSKNTESLVAAAYIMLLLSSLAAGVIALSGIYYWGHKNIWAQAVLGIAFSLFLLLLMLNPSP